MAPIDARIDEAGGFLSPAPALPQERRFALVIATSDYQDSGYHHLPAPGVDAANMAGLLGDPEICGFQVETLIDRPAADIRLAIHHAFTNRHPDDLVLVYISGHGERDQNGRLHFIATDTDPTALRATGVAAAYLLELSKDSAARRQIIILDTCFSGAFDFKGLALADFDPETDTEESAARGRCILTASRAAELSFQDHSDDGEVLGSAFTNALIEGVRTGEADVANNGRITVQDAYRYAYAAVKRKRRRQTPRLNIRDAEGPPILFARNPIGIRAGADDLYKVVADVHGPHPHSRVAALHTLMSLTDDRNPAKAAAARQTLHDVASNKASDLAPIARQLLGLDPTQPSAPEPIEPDDLDTMLGPEITEEELAGLRYDATADPLGVYSPRRVIPLEAEPSPAIARCLFPTERYRGEWRRHWIDAASMAAGSGLAAGLAYRPPDLSPLRLPAHLWEVPTPSIVQWVLVGLAVLAGRRALAWPGWRVAFTNKRVVVVRGLWWRRVTSIPLHLLVNLRISQSPLGSMLGYGTLAFGIGTWRSYHLRRLPDIDELHLRLLEEQYEPAAVEARFGRDPDDD